MTLFEVENVTSISNDNAKAVCARFSPAFLVASCYEFLCELII